MKKWFLILGLLGISVNHYFLAMEKQPFFEAVCKNDIYTLRELIVNGYNASERDDEERTPLHVAVIRNNLPAVRLLLKKIDPNVRDTHDNTALFYAIVHDRNPAIRHHLVDAGADVNIQGNRAYYPLHEALIRKQEKIISFLLARGAKSGKPFEEFNFFANGSPWGLANQMQSAGEFKFDAIQLIRGSFTLLRRLNNELLRQAGEEATTEKIRSICNLLDRGAQVNVRDKNRQTPLEKAFATFSKNKNKNPGIIELLVYYGANQEILHQHQEVVQNMLSHILPSDLVQNTQEMAK